MPVFTGDAQESGIRVQEICCFGLESIHLKVFDYIRSNKQNEVKKNKKRGTIQNIFVPRPVYT